MGEVSRLGRARQSEDSARLGALHPVDEKPLSTLGSGDQGPLQVLEATSRRAHRAQPAHSPGAPGPGPAWARKEQKAEGPGVQEAAASPPQPSCLGFLLLSLLTLRGCRSPGLLCERGRKGKLGRGGRAAALQVPLRGPRPAPRPHQDPPYT